jgi:hypothetical protein
VSTASSAVRSHCPRSLSSVADSSPSTAHIYAKAFGAGPVVFGAIPSLHAATAICCSLYVCRYSKGYRGLVFMVVYCGIMFWSTQYFHHHVRLFLPAFPSLSLTRILVHSSPSTSSSARSTPSSPSPSSSASASASSTSTTTAAD